MRIVISFLVLLLLTGCHPDPDLPIERPRDPWVLRSVLDQRPRMITLALYDDVYAAYDGAACTLFKIWRGGIHLDGAAYNNIKTVQPESWGNSFWEVKPGENPWEINIGSGKTAINPNFKGYHLKNGHLHFQYTLLLPDNREVWIKETPEFLPDQAGKPAFQQVFQTENVPPDVRIYYRGTEIIANKPTRILSSFEPIEKPVPPQRIASSNNSQYWLDRSGCNTCHSETDRMTGPSYLEIAGRYPTNKETIKNLAEKVHLGGSGVWGAVPMPEHKHLSINELEKMLRYILSLKPKTGTATPKLTNSKIKKPEEPLLKTPGFGAPLSGVHPAYDLYTVRPEWFKPRVGAMDFLSDGRLLLSTWDSIGGVYLLDQVEQGDARQVTVKRIAAGLHEPLGLKVVDEEIFVLQKHELTQLIDHDGDEQIDEYRTICNGFGVTADFHEYSYGLEYKDGFFYATLGLAMRLMSHETQHPDRGTTIRMDREGNWAIVNNGLRQANGIGKGVEGELFVTENQGQWVPACKLIHVKEGEFHGCQFQTGNRYTGLEMAAPAVWLPHHEIGNSPGQPVLIQDGPYAGHMLHGEVTNGGIKRVFLEKVNGEWQGAVFRFTQGMEAGINRLAWGPDGALYAGGVGMNGNWGWGNQQYGLQRLKYNGKPAFEMLAIRTISEGLEIEFTAPLAEGHGERPEDYLIQQWRYQPTSSYGGPKLDLSALSVQKVVISKNKRKARLSISGLKEGYVIYVLLPEDLKSAIDLPLWSGESWYTLNSKAGH